MTKHVSKPVLIVLGAAICILIYIFFFSGPKKQPQQAVQPGPVVQPAQGPHMQTTPQTPSPPVSRVALPKVDYSKLETTWVRDPFVLPDERGLRRLSEQKTPMRLTGIIDGRQGRVAVIDEEVVKRGDFVGSGERVADIGKDRVVLEHRGTRRIIVIEEPVRRLLPEEKRAEEKK